MPLEDFLSSGERIRYQSKKEIQYDGHPYVLYVTDKRILGHKRMGLIFKKDQVFSVAFEDVKNLAYHEEGVIAKKGILVLQMVGQTLRFEGSADELKDVFREMQRFIGQSPGSNAAATQTFVAHPGYTPPPPPESATSPVPQQIIYKEVVKIQCPYCKNLNPQEADRCSQCGASLH